MCLCKHWCHEKPVSIIYSECVFVALVIQHALCINHITLSSFACLAIPYFSTFSHKRYNFWRGKKSRNIKCVFWLSLQLLSRIFLILRRSQPDTVTNVHTSPWQVLVNFCLILITLELWQIFKSSSIIKFHENPSIASQIVTCSRRTDRQTDKTKITVTFHNFCKCT
jgi:hypothetical protein